VLETRTYDIDMSEIRARIGQIIDDNIAEADRPAGSPPH
jgi:hypothetical protein